MASLSSSRLAVRALTRYRSAVSVRNGTSLQHRLSDNHNVHKVMVASSSINNIQQYHQLCLQQARLQIRHFSVSSALLQTRKYTKEHEWVTMTDNIGTVGITDYAQDHLGDLVYVSLPEVGKKFFEGDEFGTVESVKAASELFCPITGEVTEVNTELEERPELINKSCYEQGWLMKLKVKDADSQLDKLLSEAEYEDFLKTIV